MINVKEVNRVEEVEVNNGYYFAKFKYNTDVGKVKVISRGIYKSRQHEPVYIPKGIFTAFVRKAYAVFYDSKKKKRMHPDQLIFNLEV